MQPEGFTILGEIRNVQAIAIGRGVRTTRRLRRKYGGPPVA
jgi:hypothetical protein